MGYSMQHKEYKCLDLKTHRLYISRHVVFNENHFPFSAAHSPSVSVSAHVSTTVPARPFFISPTRLQSSESPITPFNTASSHDQPPYGHPISPMQQPSTSQSPTIGSAPNPDTHIQSNSDSPSLPRIPAASALLL